MKRNLDTEESRAFWANIDKVHEQIKNLPQWMQDEIKARREEYDGKHTKR
jgi:hypothetical protein